MGKGLAGEILTLSWDPEGEVLWLCLSIELLSDDKVGRDVRRLSGAVHSAHRLALVDATFYGNGPQLEYVRYATGRQDKGTV